MFKKKYFCPQSVTDVAKGMIASTHACFPHIRECSFDINSAALLVIDMQKCFLDEKYHQVFVPSATSIIPQINDMVRFFDSKHRPVIYTKHMDDLNDPKMMGVWWEALVSGEMGDIYSDVNLSKDPLIVEKTQYDAFLKTGLDEILKERGIKTVVVAGIIMGLCVETSARSAFTHGYRVFLPVDATATGNRELHEASLMNLAHGFAHLCLTEDITRD